jgi:hypothetical protein
MKVLETKLTQLFLQPSFQEYQNYTQLKSQSISLLRFDSAVLECKYKQTNKNIDASFLFTFRL